MEAGDEVRARSLDAERARPDTKPQTAAELLTQLIAALRHLYRTPPDQHEQGAA